MILALVILEQAIKIIVKNYYGVRIPIIKNILYFMPVLNEDYSWINSLFQFGWSKSFHIALILIVLFISYYGFKYLKNKNIKYSTINSLKVFLFAGAICSLIDKIFWNGSLDYILLKGFFVFDLKDCYINIFIVLAAISIIKNWRKISEINDRDLILDYINFIKEDFLSMKK